MTVAADVLAELARRQLHAGRTVVYDLVATGFALPSGGGSSLAVTSVNTEDSYIGPWTVTLGLVDVGPAAVTGQFFADIEWGHSGASFAATVDYRTGTTFILHASYIRISVRGALTQAQVTIGCKKLVSAMCTPGACGPVTDVVLTAHDNKVVLNGVVSDPITVPPFAVSFLCHQGPASTSAIGGGLVRHVNQAGVVVMFTQWGVGDAGAGETRAIPSELHPLARTITIQNTSGANQEYVLQWHLRPG